MAMQEKIRSYAKINIGLKVLDKREDGFHNIDSYFHLIDLHDDIYLDLKDSSETVISIDGNKDYLDRGKDIMEKAALAFSKKTGISFTLLINIEKHIPSKAGLGGGSSNGSSILKYLNERFCNPLSMDELLDLSLSIGSDLPFFITGFSAARVKGRGEVVKEVPSLKGDVDLFVPSFSQDTKDAYYKLDNSVRSFAPLSDALEIYDGCSYDNDFELVVKRSPYFEKICQYYDYFSLSGSGSTYFGLGKKSFIDNIIDINVNRIYTKLI